MVKNIDTYDFLGGATLLINKPKGWTSFDVVNKIRYTLQKKLGVKNLKVGHAGTLDPMATGLLILCTGKATKQLADFQGLEKEYTGSFRLGATTPSYDAETEVNETFPTDHLSPELLEQTRRQFLGDIQQIPPMYSAIKVGGQPLYKKARKGETLDIQARPVHIFAFEWTNIELPNVDFWVHCSKGTYIRSLAYDFGRAAGSGAYLIALCRTRVGAFRLEEAWEVEAFVQEVGRF
jgi:tRNA pseudouridine55 synthase